MFGTCTHIHLFKKCLHGATLMSKMLEMIGLLEDLIRFAYTHQALLCLKCSGMSQGLKAECDMGTSCVLEKTSMETEEHSDSQRDRVVGRQRDEISNSICSVSLGFSYRIRYLS